MLCLLANALVISIFVLSIMGYVPPAWCYFVPVAAIAVYLFDVWKKTARH